MPHFPCLDRSLVVAPILRRNTFLLLFGFFQLCLSLSLLAQNAVTLVWDPSPSENIVGYNVYYGGSTRNYTNVVSAGNTTSVTISNLVTGCTYFFAATAIDSFGLESDFSEEAIYTVPAPGTLTNTPPTISNIPDQSIVQNSSTAAISFNVGDAQTAASSLTVTATSSNPTVIANSGIILGGSGTNRTVAIAPVYGQTGTARITLSATDGSLTATTAFQVTVNPLPTASTIKFAATSGTITAPFIVSSNTVWQSSKAGITTATTGGRAIYTFNIAVSGNYLVSMMVSAPQSRRNSLFVSMDGEPVSPTMIWDVPVTKTFRDLPVSWRGTGTSTSPQYAPKVFALSAGTHRLIVRGLEPDTAFREITISPATSASLATSAAAMAPLSLTDNPVLSLAPCEGGLVLSWPSSDTTWILEQSENFGSWSAVSEFPTDDGTNNTVFVSPDSKNTLFRLRRVLTTPQNRL